MALLTLMLAGTLGGFGLGFRQAEGGGAAGARAGLELERLPPPLDLGPERPPPQPPPLMEGREGPPLPLLPLLPLRLEPPLMGATFRTVIGGNCALDTMSGAA